MLGEIDITVNVFGNKHGRFARRRLVKVTLQSLYDNIQHVMEAIEIEHTCEVVAEVQDHEFIKELRNRRQQLADALCFSHITQEEGISLLIGSDRLGKILGSEVTWNKDSKSLFSIQTTLSWTVQGP